MSNAQSPLDSAGAAQDAFAECQRRHVTDGQLNGHLLKDSVKQALKLRGWAYAEDDTVSRVLAIATGLAEAAGIRVV